ncbi:type II toxin-antitoxin system RelE/ParE family toxin [uncultured Holdemanella sp.]|uniref:type II toxin-antitoxin system RelE/ParE family toxin n=1 Tax=uncultured Holdemanella sp. TaxID=1763549 RepID=UPI0025F0C4AA|nr:type II toxin-antitoxin system RelE/ParE family toxin [uncultured Holdemanella sp.]
MKYTIVRTDTADVCIRKIVMFIARNFGEDIALKKLNDLEKNIYLLEDNPYLGIAPRYPVLKRQGYKVLILEKDLIFYKINEDKKEIIIYAVVDQRQDYLNIIQGL